MLNVRPGDRVRVRADPALQGSVDLILGLGAGADIKVTLDTGAVMSFRPAELELLVPEPA